MKKKLYSFLLIIFCITLLTGCNFTKNKYKRLCNKINADINDYKNNKLSYEAFIDKIKVYYEKDCENNDTSKICSEIKVSISMFNNNYKLKDRDQYPEGSLKDNCITENNITDIIIENKDKYESSTIDSLSKYCNE